MVAHTLKYWPNVGPFRPSLPQPPNLTSLRKLQYTSARTNVTHASIVAHALACLPNVEPLGPSLPQPPNLTSLWKLLNSRILLQLFERVGRGGGLPARPLVGLSQCTTAVILTCCKYDQNRLINPSTRGWGRESS